jgi:ferrous iron transport protein B
MNTNELNAKALKFMPSPKLVAIIGNPNCGKSTLFNHLTGLNQKTANYPGVTVEKRQGALFFEGKKAELIDLPGTHSIYPHSEDENIAIKVLKGEIEHTRAPDKIIYVLDATQIYQGTLLLQQLSTLNIPTIVVLTMNDVAQKKEITLDLKILSEQLNNCRVIAVNAKNGSGMNLLIKAILDPEIKASKPINPIDTSMSIEKEIQYRFEWSKKLVEKIQVTKSKLDLNKSYQLVNSIVNKPLSSTILFIMSMAIVFQAVFAWATPLMDLIDHAATTLEVSVSSWLPAGLINSFITDGIISGVGSVIIFLPQILILFLFIILMEDTGYLSRAAFLSDRLMRHLGLSGQSVIPLLSSFACAVPAIMATRVIPSNRDRIVTILTAPFMTCSARLPIYALLIGAFVPQQHLGWLNIQGLVLLSLYLLGIFGGTLTALLLRKTILSGPKPNFIQAIPEFRIPDLQSVLFKLIDRAKVFLKRAGTIILFVSMIVWALSYFPRSETIASSLQDNLIEVTDEAARDALINEAASDQLAQSWLGRSGRTLEPLFKPLGWDWRITAAVIAGFPAREVVVAVMGTIYAVGDQADELTLSNRLQAALDEDGNPIFTLPMVIGLLIFYAWCLQCVATLAIIKRETNSWKWPLISWIYMTTLGYLGALAAFQIGSAL